MTIREEATWSQAVNDYLWCLLIIGWQSFEPTGEGLRKADMSGSQLFIVYFRLVSLNTPYVYSKFRYMLFLPADLWPCRWNEMPSGGIDEEKVMDAYMGQTCIIVCVKDSCLCVCFCRPMCVWQLEDIVDSLLTEEFVTYYYLFNWIQHKDRIFHILSIHESLQFRATLENMNMASGRHRDSSMVAGWLAASLWSGRAGIYSLYSAELSPYSWVSSSALCLHILHHSSSKVRICVSSRTSPDCCDWFTIFDKPF